MMEARPNYGRPRRRRDTGPRPDHQVRWDQMMMNRVFQDDAAELAHYRARVARNARRRARRTPGGDYVAQQIRQAAYGASYAAAGTVGLAQLDQVAQLHQRVIEQAVIRLVQDDHYSWAQIGAELGISRQAAQQRFGPLVKSSRRQGAQPAHLR